MNQAIKQKYFDNGLRTFLAKDYFNVDIMIALAMLQNGQMPLFLEENILHQVVSSTKNSDPCVFQLQRGLEMLGMLSAIQQLPMLMDLLRPNVNEQISVPKLLQILKPKFSVEGSNALKRERELYHMFVKYSREAAGGRRLCGQKRLELSDILQFVTGASEEPVLGFAKQPEIHFIMPLETETGNTNE